MDDSIQSKQYWWIKVENMVLSEVKLRNKKIDVKGDTQSTRTGWLDVALRSNGR